MTIYVTMIYIEKLRTCLRLHVNHVYVRTWSLTFARRTPRANVKLHVPRCSFTYERGV